MFYQATSNLENNLLDAVTVAIMLPVQAVYGSLCLLWSVLQGAMGLVRALRWAMWPALLTAGVVLGLALCVAVPALPVGLLVVAGYGWASYPRCKGCA